MATPEQLKQKYYKSGDLYFATPYGQQDVYGTELSREQYISDVGGIIGGYQQRGLVEGSGYSKALADSLRAAQADTPSGYVSNLKTGRPQTFAEYQRGTPEGQAQEAALSASNLASAQAQNPVDTRYFLQPGETIDKYNARLATFNLPSGATAIGNPPTTPLSSANIGTGTTPAYTPAPTPLGGSASVPGYEPLAATPQEAKISAETEAIRKQQQGLVGEGAYRAEQGQATNLPELTRLQNDLSSQLKVSQLEAANIQAQTQEAGAGVTTAIDTRQKAEALRKNSVKSLQIFAQLEMAKGNVATAQDAVDRAVELKFGTLKEQIAVAKSNLELLIADLETTRQDKDRAIAQKAILDAREKAITRQEENTKGAETEMLKYVNALSQLPNGSAILQEMGKATTALGVAQVATRYGVSSEKAVIAGAVTADAPMSYKEWELAGKPGTYEQWLKDSNVKVPTVAQQTVAEYAARIEQANPIIQTQEANIVGMNLASFLSQINLPAAFQSSDIQQYVQAARNFINAKLRRESGAVISATEFSEARQQYLPQPGDSVEVLVQKKANRDLVYASLRTAAGNAYQSVDELLGTGNDPLGLSSGSGVTTANPLGI